MKYNKKIDILIFKYDTDKLETIINYLPKIKNKFKGKNLYVYEYLESSIQEKLGNDDDIITNLEDEFNNITDSNKTTKIKNYNNIPENNIYPKKDIIFGDYPDTETLGKNLNINDSEIPTGEFNAYFLNTNESNKIIATDKVKNIGLNYAWSNFNDIKSEDFGAYYVGYMNFDNDEEKNIQYSISWSELRVIIDGKLVISSKNNGGEKNFLFKKGKHKIEVEYINNWHTTNYNVTFKSLNEKKLSDNSNLVDLVTDDTKILYFGVYESANQDNSINVNLKYTDSPAIIVLTSYEAVLWNIKNITPNIKAIIYSSYAKGSSVEVDNNTDVIRIDNLGYGYTLEPSYNSVGGILHFESYGLKKINESTNKLFGKNIYGFNGNYSLSSGNLPEKIITNELKDYYDNLLIEIEKNIKKKVKKLMNYFEIIVLGENL